MDNIAYWVIIVCNMEDKNKNYRLETIKFFANQYYGLTLERIKTIILMVQLLIALLVIASFSENIIPSSSVYYLKILIVFLLFLIPIMLADYLLQLNDGLNSLHKVLKFKNKRKKWYKELANGSNYIYALIIIFVIDIIIQLINQNFKITLMIFLIQVIFIAVLIFSRKKGRDNENIPQEN